MLILTTLSISGILKFNHSVYKASWSLPSLTINPISPGDTVNHGKPVERMMITRINQIIDNTIVLKDGKFMGVYEDINDDEE